MRSIFTQVVITENNELRFIHISGQVGVDHHKNITGRENLQIQTRQALKNLKTVLEYADTNMNDGVKLLMYVVHDQYTQAAIIKEGLLRFFPENRLPALSLIGTVVLADQDFLIEIDAEAIAAIAKH